MTKRLAIIGPSAPGAAALAQAMKSDRLRPGCDLPQPRLRGGECAPVRRRQIERGQLKAENGLAR